jgi:hypothetical protein
MSPLREVTAPVFPASVRNRREDLDYPASIHSAAPHHSVSRRSGRKNPMCPIRLAPASAGVTVTISGVIEVNPEHSSSTAGSVAQGSSDMQSARNAP